MPASVTIIVPANNAQIPNGATVNANGTFGPAGGGTMTQVRLSVVFSDGNENEQQIGIPAVLNQATGTWTASFTLPLWDWRYIFSAMAISPLDGTKDRKDCHLDQGSPP